VAGRSAERPETGQAGGRVRSMPAVADAMATAGAAPFRKVASAIVAATVVAMFLGSKAALSWASDLPINRMSDLALYCAQAWHDQMDAADLPRVAEELRAAFRRFQGWGKG
jgi:hypothetical protein